MKSIECDVKGCIETYLGQDLKVKIADNSISTCFQYNLNLDPIKKKEKRETVMKAKIYQKTLDLIQKDSVRCWIGSSC